MTPWRILVVDDEPFNLEIIGDVLDDPIYAVTKADNGLKAWEWLTSATMLPHLLILDRMMPVMDGMELLRRVKADPRFIDIPVIMQTAAASAEQVAEGIAAGAWYYLPKPYAPADLLTIVRAALADVAEQQAITAASRHRDAVLLLLDEAEFGLRTLEDARLLSAALASLCPDPARAALGLSELMVNAIEHGNLGIGYDEKAEMRRNGDWESAVESRLADPVLGARRARVRLRREADALFFTIVDQGAGFEWARYVDFDPERAFDPNGRGIAMARHACFASIDYKGCGNEVVARVSLSGSKGGECQ